MDSLTGTNILMFIIIFFCTAALMLSHLPFFRRLNRDMWRFALVSMGKQQRLEPAVRMLDAWTAWLGFTGGLSLLPLCIGLLLDLFCPDADALIVEGCAPFAAILSLLLLILSTFICTFVSLIRWLYLRGRAEAPTALPPLP